MARSFLHSAYLYKVKDRQMLLANVHPNKMLKELLPYVYVYTSMPFDENDAPVSSLSTTYLFDNFQLFSRFFHIEKSLYDGSQKQVRIVKHLALNW